jgi:hypothetical protein
MTDPNVLTAEAIGQIADQYYEAFPDIRALAAEWGARLLKRHTGMTLSPDYTYWNHFDNAQNNSLAHSGWQHYGPPTLSMSVTELVMRRFNLYDQINAIDLDSTSGFYYVNKSTLFDQTNEVPLLPSLIMQDFWSTDFSTVYTQKLNQFWDQQTRNGRLLLKALFFGFAWKAHADGVLTANQLKIVLNTLGGTTSLPPTLDNLRAENTQRHFARLYSFTLGGQTAADILRVKCPDDTELLYMAPDVFKPFESQQAMYEWLRHEAADPRQRANLLMHFGDYSLDNDVRESLSGVLDTLQAQPWHAGQTELNSHSVEITGDAFSYLFQNVRRRLDHDTRVLLQSNYELRRELFLEDLDALVRISSGLAPGDPLIALVTVGAASLSFGSHLARSIAGRDRRERQIAFRKALLDAVTMLLELPLLKGTHKNAAADFADLERDLDSESHGLSQTSINVDAPTPWQAYVAQVEIDDLAEGSGLRTGVFMRDAEHFYIRMDGQVLQVRFLGPLKRWYVVNPAEPASLVGSWPVERDWQGRWVPLLDLASTRPQPPLDIERPLAELRQYETNPDYEPLIEVLTRHDASRLLTGPLDSLFRDARDELLRLRQSLADKSLDLLVPRPGPPSPAIPEVSADMKPGRFLETVYSDAYGLVIGESRGSIASKKLLVKYMAQLKQLGVDTLFVEGLIRDLDQPGIDLFWRTGHMPRSLEKRLLALYDQSPRLDVGRFSHYRVLTEARRQGIKVRALDCAASLSDAGLPSSDPSTAHRMRVFYASELIRTHQAGVRPSRWIALLDQTRAGAYFGIKGVAELTGTVHLRVNDIDRLLPTRFSIDVGQVIKHPPGLVKGDVKLDLGTRDDLLTEKPPR